MTYLKSLFQLKLPEDTPLSRLGFRHNFWFFSHVRGVGSGADFASTFDLVFYILIIL